MKDVANTPCTIIVVCLKVNRAKARIVREDVIVEGEKDETKDTMPKRQLDSQCTYTLAPPWFRLKVK